MMHPEDVRVRVAGSMTTASDCYRVGSLVRCEIRMESGEVEFHQAYDAAGNAAQVPDGAITKRTIARDTTPPRVSILAIDTGAGFVQSDVVTIPGSRDVRIVTQVIAEGSEASRGRITIRGADTRVEEVSFDCQTEPVGDLARCTSDPIMISESSRLVIEVFDASGTPYRAERFVEVGGVSVPGGSDWRVLDVSASPGFYLPTGRMPLTIEARIGSSLLSSALTIAGASVVSCEGVDGAFVSSFDRRVTITGYSVASELSSGSGSCVVSITSNRDGRIDPDPEEVTIEFSLVPITAAGIEDPRDLYESSDSAAKLDSFLSSTQTVLDYATVVCDGYEAVNKASFIVNTAAAALGGDLALNPIAATLAAAGSALFEGSEAFGTIADPLCPVVHCAIPHPDGDGTIQDRVLDWYAAIEGPARSGINSRLGFSAVSEDQSISRIEDSLVLSTITACVPGVIENAQRFTQAQCARDLCLLQTYTGDYSGSASMCSYAYSMQMCTLVGDEVLAITPYGGIVDELTSNFGSIIHRPLQFAIDWGVDTLARSSPTLRAILNEDMVSLILDMSSPSSGSAPEVPDYCSDLLDYLDDLEERGIFT